MNKRFLTLLAAVSAAVLFLSGGVLLAAESQTVPDEVTIESEGYKKDKKGPVKLSHKAHVDTHGVACADCHHVYKDGKNEWKEGDHVDKCSKCHDPEKKDGKVMKLQNAYHRNCKNCHKDLVKENKDSKAPYRKCNDCHGKKAK